MKFALTKAAKRQMIWTIRFRMEVLGRTPVEALRSVSTSSRRFNVLLDRWIQRVWGANSLAAFEKNTIGGSASCPLALDLTRKLWLDIRTALPSKPDRWLEDERTQRNLPEPTWHVWVDLSDAEEGDGEGGDPVETENEGENEGEGEGESGNEEFEIVDANSDGETKEGECDGNFQSDWGDEELDPEREREIERELARISNRHNNRPFDIEKDFNKKEIECELPKSNQLIGKVRKALLADSRNRITRHRDSGQLDITRLHDIAQMTDVNTVYERNRKGKKLDVCVQVYIDESWSMHESVGGHRLMGYAAAAAAVLSKSMDQLRIQHQLLVFTQEVKVIKGWRGKWQNAHLNDLGPTDGTKVPAALRDGLKLMKDRREKRKIAIVLTDGDMSSTDSFWNKGNKWEKLKRQGFEVYAIGLMNKVLSSDPNYPNHDWRRCVGVGDTVYHYHSEIDFKKGIKESHSKTVGINGGIDNVNPKTMIPQLSKHLVEVFTEGRQVIR